MRISDWSSDVCSSDLNHRSDGFLSGRGRLPNACAFVGVSLRRHALCKVRRSSAASKCRACRKTAASKTVMRRISGQAESPQDRKSVVWGKSVSVGVDLGGRRIIKKKNQDK